ncbi:MAG TPA: aldehyde dehydrogenase family protein [Acidimicrobiales bacterium]
MAFDTPYRLLIGGEWVDGESGSVPIRNPATGDVVGEAPEASTLQAIDACDAAADAFEGWASTPIAERAAVVGRAAALMRERADDFVPLVQAETGATLRVTKTMQVPSAIGRLEYYARRGLEPMDIPIAPASAPSTALAPGGLIGALVNHAPIGVVACITPYNFPIVNMAGKIGPALVMGNTVVVKPALQDPLAVIRMVEVMAEAGFPSGVINLITCTEVPPAEAIVASPKVDMVSFTGSTAVGSRIAEMAAPRMCRLLLELGGKGASIVFDDADMKAAIGGTSSTWSFHSGQICTSPTRAIVHRSVYDQFVEGMGQMASALKVGDPLEADTVVGPVISEAHRDRVESYVAAGKGEGATIAAGGERSDLAGAYVVPTLLADCTPTMTPVREEIFGPVVVVLPFDDDDEAVAMANDTPFGLFNYVFSRDSARAASVARRLRSGNVGINTLQRNPEAPFGGMKMSGVGRDGGVFGLHAYSEMQSILWNG